MRLDATLPAQTMRAVVQRVSSASVTINGAAKAGIGPGLLVLVAFEESDDTGDLDWLVGKLVRLRIFNDEDGIMNCSVLEIRGEILMPWVVL